MTNKMKVMNRDNAKLLRAELDNTFKALGKRLGLSFSVGRIVFDDYSVKATVEAAITSGSDKPKMAIDFEKMCFKYGFNPSDLGRIFSNNGKQFKIVGLKPRNRKYPVIAERTEDGKQFKFSASAVKMLI